MSKFEFQVTKILDAGKVWEHNITVNASNKLEAAGKVEQIFPYPEYKCELIETC